MAWLVLMLVSMSVQVTLVLGEHRNFAFHHSGEEAQPEILAGQRKALNLRYSRAGRLGGVEDLPRPRQQEGTLPLWQRSALGG